MEKKINNILIKARTASNYQLSLGNKQASEDILNQASKLVLRMIKHYRLNGLVICSICHKKSFDAIERDLIREYGVCLGCNKIYSEIIKEQIEYAKQ